MDLRDDMRLFGIDSAEGEERQRASTSEPYALINHAAKRDTSAIAKLITHHILSWRPLFRRALARCVSARGNTAGADRDGRTGAGYEPILRPVGRLPHATRGRRYWAVKPPSIGSSAPVT
jgi:hypothetical protein